MKKYKISLIVINVLIIITTCVFLLFLDDIIPTHFGVDGSPDNFGSKYFLLVFPGLALINTVVMLLVYKFVDLTENYQKYMFLTGVIFELLLLGVSVFFSVYALFYDEGNEIFDMSKLMMILVGLLLIFVGNYMPKVEKNSTLGLKTKWAKYNEVTWQKSQRFMAFASFVSGVVILVSGIFFEEVVNFIILTVFVLGAVISGTIASYIYYKNEKANENN